MSKIEDARLILHALGLPSAQQNDMACLTLLALTGMTEDRPWSSAQRRPLTIHQMLTYMKEAYGREYAENTRETVRRQVIHQFEQARIVDRNPDQPDLPTNSPLTHYAITDIALMACRSYGTNRWEQNSKTFIAKHGALIEVYRRTRRMQQIPVRLSTGEEIRLSPGKHNQLQSEVVKSFAPRFAPKALLLYMGDAADKLLHIDREGLQQIGVPVTEHDKLPDVLLFCEDRNWLLLVEVVTSHGPVTPKRFQEIEQSLQNCKAHRIYVSAFPALKEFKRHIDEIAWETEVWISEISDHLIHFNGDKFLSRHKVSQRQTPPTR